MIFAQGIPAAPGFYWQYWTEHGGPYLRQVYLDEGELFVVSYNNPKEVKRHKLSNFSEASYWSHIVPPDFVTPPR